MEKQLQNEFLEKEGDKIRIIIEELLLARTMWKNKDIAYKLSATFIYAGLAEFFALSILEFIEYEKLSITTEKIRKNTNLGFLIYALKKHNFESKAELIDVLQAVKNARNNMFHNFYKSKESDGRIIEKNTEELFHLWSAITHTLIVGLKSKYKNKYLKSKTLGWTVFEVKYVNAKNRKEALENAKFPKILPYPLVLEAKIQAKN